MGGSCNFSDNHKTKEEMSKLEYSSDHIVGTNGKGSTGRYLASLLQQLNQKVLHYSSPHILKFNERIWIEGTDVSDEILLEGGGYGWMLL